MEDPTRDLTIWHAFTDALAADPTLDHLTGMFPVEEETVRRYRQEVSAGLARAWDQWRAYMIGQGVGAANSPAGGSADELRQPP